MEKSDSSESCLPHAEKHDSHPPKAEPASESNGDAPTAGNVGLDKSVEDDYEYITGLKLATVIGCVSLVAFLILLDQSIISTVRHFAPRLPPLPSITLLNLATGYSTYHQRFSFPA